MVIALPLWVILCFGIVQIVLLAVLLTLQAIGVPVQGFNQALLSTTVAALTYILSLAMVIGLPWWLKKRRTTKDELGITRLPSWMDIGLAPAGFIIYLLCSAALVYIVASLIPQLNINQTQETGFDSITYGYEYILAFITLVVIAPIAEEILFRGYLYGKLRKFIPLWAVIIIVSVVFGLVHGQWNVAIDVFALSVVLCLLREITGNIWSGVILHMMKNGLAFYLLFVNPALMRTMGG